ncbi:hypothetical protein DIPPA_19612 [Diplonema papillatum]|nr:hypothetical protein DIPPA_19612 [Diplonema papillatum]
MSRALIRIDVTSDILCPFCWVGKRCIEQAIAKRKDKMDFEVVWHPFFLRRGVPPEGIDKLEGYAEKFGREKAEYLLGPQSPMTERGRQVGIEFNYKKGCVIGDSTPGHRMLWYVYDKHGAKKQNELMEVIFRRYFQENQNIGDLNNMVGAAKEVGLPEAEMSAFLKSSEYLDKIDQADRENHMKGISGVPHFEIRANPQDSPAVASGAQEPDHFVRIFDRLAARVAA